jgi:hypothetical protein
MKCETCGTQLLFVAHDGDDNVTGLRGDYFCPNPNCGDVEELVSDDATLVEEIGLPIEIKIMFNDLKEYAKDHTEEELKLKLEKMVGI